MRYDNQLLVDTLATEYILGALKGAAQIRFKQLLRQRSDLAQTFHWWESHMHLLADTVPATQPQKKLWQNIENRLFSASIASTRANNTSWWKSLAFFLPPWRYPLQLF